MSSIDPNFTFNNVATTMGSIIREQKPYETIGGIITILWLLGGLFGDEYLYFISMTTSLIIFGYATIFNLIPKNRSFALIHTGSFRRLLVAVVADWGYTTGRKKGASSIEFLNYTISISEIVNNAIIVLFVIWIFTKYADVVDNEGFSFIKTPILLIRGIFRGILLVAGFISLLRGKGKIPEELIPFVLISFILEPITYYIYSVFNQSYSSSDMLFGSSRLPSVALRESFLSNLMLLFLIMWMDGQTSSEFELLRVLYIIGLIFSFYTSFEAIKNYNKNPFGNSSLGDFLNNGGTELQNINLSNQIAHVINEEMNLVLGKSSSYKLSKDSLIIPLEEKKGMISAMIVGKAESIIDDGKQKVSQEMDGVTTALIPKGKFKKIRKELVAKQLNDLDLGELGLPNLDIIENVVNELGMRMQGWVDKLRNELTKFNLSNYSVTETEDGSSMVNLPGISVVETHGLTQVKVAGIRVYETPQVTSVRIGSLMSVVEFPKMTFVSLPGITVMDLGKHGTAVDLFGLKISDKVSAERLNEFKEALLKQMDIWENRMESKIGKILADSGTQASMSLSWSGEFKPMLKAKNGGIGDHPALPASLQLDQQTISNEQFALPASVEANQEKLYELTGFDPTETSTNKKKRIKIEIKVKNKKLSATKGIEENQKHMDRNDKFQTIEDKLNKVDEKIANIKSNMQGQNSKKSYDFKEIHDAEYEVVDESDELDYEIEE